jgi:hypothetical protein
MPGRNEVRECPHCGAEIPAKALACPECGSDEQTGWSEAAATEGLDLPEENFDYQDFVEREFSGKSPVPRGIHWGWWITAVILLAGIIYFFVSRF